MVPIRRAIWVAVAIAIPSVGCSSIGSLGDLRRGRFSYECTQASDAACDAGDPAPSVWDNDNGRPMPEVIAVGGSFRVHYWDGDINRERDVVAASTGMLSRASDGFTISKAGYAALIAKDSAETVLDFIHMEGAPIASLDLQRDGYPLSGAIELPVGATTRLVASALDAKGRQLSGGVSCWWSIDKDDIVHMDSSSDNRIVVTGTSPGTATAKVTMGSKSATVSFEVW